MWDQFVVVVQRHRLVYGVIAALIIASLLTAVSMALYVSSGASRLDLSRPGYEKAREAVKRDPAEKPFSPSGPLNTRVLEDFQERYTERRSSLQRFDDYSSSALSDQELQIAPGTNTP